MPNHTVSGDVDSMLRSANDAAIRSAIGVGTTDAPTFNSVNITNTATANVFSTSAAALQTSGYLGVARAINLIDTAGISWSSTSTLLGATGTNLLQDAAGILAQRNTTSPQAFRVYNSTDATPATNYDRGVFDFKTTTNTLRIGTENGGTYTTARPIDFVTGGVACWQISAAGHFLAATHNAYDIGASGGVSCPRNIHVAGGIYPSGVIQWASSTTLLPVDGNGTLRISNTAGNDFNRLQLGGVTNSFPAIARDGAGTKFTGGAAGSTSWIKVPAVAVASLPAAATAGVGARSFVNDALTPVFGSAVTGGGAVNVPVYSTGSAWNVG